MTQAAEKSVLDLELEDLEGVGPAKAKKMREAGIGSVIQLATASADELALDTGWDKDAAASVIMSAQKLLRESNFLDKEFMTGDQRGNWSKRKLNVTHASFRLSSSFIFLNDVDPEIAVDANF